MAYLHNPCSTRYASIYSNPYTHLYDPAVAHSYANTNTACRSAYSITPPLAFSPTTAPLAFGAAAASYRPIAASGLVSGINYIHVADRALENLYGIERRYLDFDLRRFRGSSIDPRLISRPLYPTGYPCFNYPSATAGLGVPNPYYGQTAIYPNGYPLYGYPDSQLTSYPPVAPECRLHTNCAANANPNDCRSCVTAQGGSPHCANHICGPHRLNC